MNIFQFNISGSVWREASSMIQLELSDAVDSGSSYPIERIFQFIELTQANEDLKNRLISRGSFEPKGGGTYENRGIPISQAVTDIHQDIGRVGLFIPRNARVTVSGDLIVRIAPERRHRVVLSFRDRPPTAGFGRRFSLIDIEFTEDGVTYQFVDQADEERILVLFVDYSLSPEDSTESSLFASTKNDSNTHTGIQVFSTASMSRFQAASLISANALSDGPCPCCNPVGEVPKPCFDPGGDLEVKIHLRTLVAPYYSIAAQVNATNEIFSSAGISCSVISDESLNLPHLNHYDAGPCSSRGNSPDQIELSQYRDGAGSNEIVIYWVDSIDSNIGALAGCAASLAGKPMVVMSKSASQYVLAHEIGHVLDLGHTPKEPVYRTRLMYPEDNFIGQPNIIDNEQKTIRCSRLST